MPKRKYAARKESFLTRLTNAIARNPAKLKPVIDFYLGRNRPSLLQFLTENKSNPINSTNHETEYGWTTRNSGLIIPKNNMNLYFDFEFTGLHKATTPISLGITAGNGFNFYAQFTDYNEEHIVNQVGMNIVPELKDIKTNVISKEYVYMKGTKAEVVEQLKLWLYELIDILKVKEKIIMVGDVIAYDWVLFCDLFGTAFDLPKEIHYIPIDISTLFAALNIDSDINRLQFLEQYTSGVSNGITYEKHNALNDALIIKVCYTILHSTLMNYSMAKNSN